MKWIFLVLVLGGGVASGFFINYAISFTMQRGLVITPKDPQYVLRFDGGPHLVTVFAPTPVPVWNRPLSPTYPTEWVTNDGHVYHHVKVTDMAADAITIIHSDGVAMVDMQNLSPDLQKVFNYDPEAAAYAANLRAQQPLDVSPDSPPPTADGSTPSPEPPYLAVTNPTPTPTPVSDAQKIQDLKDQIASVTKQADEADKQGENSDLLRGQASRLEEQLRLLQAQTLLNDLTPGGGK